MCYGFWSRENKSAHLESPGVKQQGQVKFMQVCDYVLTHFPEHGDLLVYPLLQLVSESLPCSGHFLTPTHQQNLAEVRVSLTLNTPPQEIC